MKRKTFASEFKYKVANDVLKSHKAVNELTSEFDDHTSQIKTWKKQLMDMTANSGYQLDFFNTTNCAANDDELMNTLDKLNQRFGRKTVFFAAQGVKQPWAMKRNFLTKAFTTRWSDIPVVR